MSNGHDSLPFGFQSLHCQLTVLGDEAIVSVGGEIDLVTMPRLLRELVRPLYPPVSTLVVDLADVTFIDSSGIQALVTARSAAVTVGTRFMLSSVPPIIRQRIHVLGLADLFDITAE